jgi:hypothetical protein
MADQLVSINGISLVGVTHAFAVNALKTEQQVFNSNICLSNFKILYRLHFRNKICFHRFFVKAQCQKFQIVQLIYQKSKFSQNF